MEGTTSMADDRQGISFPTQTTPGSTELSDDTGARSAYDPPLSPQQASAAAFASQLAEAVSGDGVTVAGTPDVSGVTRSVVQTPGFRPSPSTRRASAGRFRSTAEPQPPEHDQAMHHLPQ
jgi:hypothetical protein